ncbi:MAG: FAD-dependent oxidoreductase [Zestosphaera sp.]
MSNKRVCVVGGGLAGLSTAYHLLRRREDLKITVLESSNKVGGLLKSEMLGGYLFDIGGSHIIFSKHLDKLKEMLSFLKGNHVKHYRNTKVYYKGTYVKYPFENGLHDLPPEERFECVWGAVEAYVKRLKNELREPQNFLEWLPYVFGEGIASKYLIPYNEKIWKTDLSEITLEWVEGRVPTPPIKEIIMSAVGINVEGYTHQLTFYYPTSGGIEALVQGLLSEILSSKRVEVLTNQEVKRVSFSSRDRLLVETRDYCFECVSVVYTASLKRSRDTFKEILGGLSNDLEKLRSVPIAVVGLGIKGEVRPYHWVYLPDKKHLPHRIAVLSNFSRSNAPPEGASIIAEVSFKNEDELRSVPEDQLVRKSYEDLLEISLIKNPELEVSKVWRWRDAYIIYDKNRPEILKKAEEELRKLGVFINGRFGAWEYLNMDATYMKSEKIAEEVIKYVRHAYS